MSHISGDRKFGPVSMRHTRTTPPRSISTNMPARQMLTVDTITAGSATFLKALMLNTWAELATIRPPAESPTKNMNMMM